jgi:aspartyl-tRNA(Asn)/glutamyl-tRNA(Gln) amidotransferase subunit A
MTNLADWTAVELTRAFATKQASPVESLEATLKRAEACEPSLRALYLYNPEAARAAAKASEARWARGEPAGPLDGVAVTIKENISTRGDPAPIGTAASDLTPALADAPPAARLKESGAIVFAKTTMPDYGMLSSGLSSFHPLTRNPWDLTKNPGGSSSGAGAAAAAGYGPIHMGTDIGGSVRLPAGWCGVAGLKPSAGRIPIDPPYVGRVAGPLCRSVADIALAMGVLTRPDRRDHMSLPYQEIDWGAPDFDIRGKRVGLMLEAGFGWPAEPQVKAAVEAAARAFERAGATVVAMAPFMTQEMMNGLDRFWRARAWADISRLPEARQAKILPFILAWARAAAPFDGQQVFTGFEQVMVIRRAAVAAFADVDFALTPTAPMTAFAAELPAPGNDPDHPLDHIGFTVPYNMTGQPALSVNCGASDAGLPIGLQIIGQRFDDPGVLQMGALYETLRGSQPAWPQPPFARKA